MRTPRFAVRLVIAASLLSGGAAAQVWEVGNLRLYDVGYEAGDQLGHSLAVGDLDADGDDDFVVGIPFRANTNVNAGAVFLFRSVAQRTFERQGWTGPDEWMGWAVAVGNFDGVGANEVAVGIPRADVGPGPSVPDAGRVRIIRWGFTEEDSLYQGDPGQTSEPGDQFGEALAVGDFDDDGYDDLAVGTPHEDLVQADVGKASVFYGGPGGLDDLDGFTFFAGMGGVLGAPGPGDQFGYALAAGDFDDDGYDDLAIGAPFRDVSGIASAGEVHVLFGSANGLSAAGDLLLNEASFGATIQASDFFGYALAAADFDRPVGIVCLNSPTSCVDDLAIGVPGQDIGTADAAGKAVIAYGQFGVGPNLVGATTLTQSTVPSPVDFSETGDFFGSSLASGRLDRPRPGFLAADPHDLVIGVQLEDAFASDSGAVQIVFGDPAGLDAGAGQGLWARAGFRSAPPQQLDRFGKAVGIGDFDGDGYGDLAIGLPGRDLSGGPDAGVVQVLFGALFADGFDRASSTAWWPVVP